MSGASAFERTGVQSGSPNAAAEDFLLDLGAGTEETRGRGPDRTSSLDLPHLHAFVIPGVVRDLARRARRWDHPGRVGRHRSRAPLNLVSPARRQRTLLLAGESSASLDAC
jgi:hypothetical protein